MITINTPNITAGSDHEQLIQTRSYLYQLSKQLQWAFETIETGGGSGGTATQKNGTGKSSAQKETANTFNQIKSLIIKSADIVNAYYEKINARLEGVYVAQSDFGTFSEQTSQDIKATSTALEQVFSDLQEIFDTVEGIEEQTLQTSAYIKSGLLYYGDDGNPVYGLEVGQTNTVDGESVFDKFARFTADRLSFYDRNDTEVAYISDYKLYITHAQITGSLTVGSYKLDTANGLAFKWIGGDST